MNTFAKAIIGSAILLGLFAIAGTGLVSFTHESTRERIAENERQAILKNIHVLIHPQAHDNDIFNDTQQITDREFLGSDEPMTVYRARKQGEPVGAVFTCIAPNGYSGNIKMLVGVRHDGQLTGVRILAHRETPGLGDAIERERSDWILQFDGKTLHNPGENHWKVKKDGGVFDQMTGATITPRAVVQAVHKVLLYYRQHQQELFAAPAESKAEPAHE